MPILLRKEKMLLFVRRGAKALLFFLAKEERPLPDFLPYEGGRTGDGVWTRESGDRVPDDREIAHTDTGLPAELTGLWAVSQAITPLLSPRLTDTYVQGATGGVLRPASFPLFYSDVGNWLLPGLAACGLDAACHELPDTEPELAAWLRPFLQRGRTLPLLRFAPPETFPAAPNDAEGAVPTAKTNTEAELAAPPADTALLRQGLLVRLDASSRSAMLRDTTGQEQTLSLSQMWAEFSQALTCRKSVNALPRREQVPGLLRRWAVFAASHPERITFTEQNTPLRLLCASFLHHLAGKGRSPIDIRLRRVSSLLATAQENAEIEEAFHLLREIVCFQLDLPVPIQNALLAPQSEVLTEAECRELIYLARAGTRDVKILALHRLRWETQRSDARRTLDALRYDPDAWARAACAAL